MKLKTIKGGVGDGQCLTKRKNWDVGGGLCISISIKIKKMTYKLNCEYLPDN